MKKIMPKLLVLVMVVSILSTCLVGCGGKGPKDGVENASFVNLDINPNIDLVVDGNSKVVSVVANNDDAEKLLVNVDVKGKDVKVAVNLIVKQSVNDGYISESNTDINVSATNSNGEKYDKLAKNVKEQAEKTFNEAKKTVAAIKDLTLEVSTDVARSVTARLEATKAYLKENGDKAAQKAAEKLTEGKLLLMETVNELTDGAIAMEELVKMKMSELNGIIVNIGKNVETISKNAIDEVKKNTTELVIQLQDQILAEQAKVMDALENSEIKGAYDAKCAFVASQKLFVKAINEGSDALDKLYDKMQTAPNTVDGQTELSNSVDEFVDDLYKDNTDAQKAAFKDGLKETVDGKVRYTYKSVATKLEKQYDTMDANKLSSDGLIIKGYVQKLTKYRVNNTKLSKAAKLALEAAKTATTAGINAYIVAVNLFNDYIRAEKYEYVTKNFNSLNELVEFTTELLTKQNANIEVAFENFVDQNATAEEKAALEEHKAKIQELKNKMATVKDEAVKAYKASLKASQNA